MKTDLGIIYGGRVAINHDSAVTGVERIASQFINVLLADPMTLMQDGFGAGLLDKLGVNLQIDELRRIITVRVQQALDLLKEKHDENPTLNDDEKIEEVTIESINQSGTNIELEITITTQAATRETIGVTL